ncbi:helix-turn-helix domain-containing protein [Plantactinospora endophytica]|uniref:Transcriptional regulator n=1 Tax=Plantactinospora endophytica TaxID=673535 RepID=A0ABQ4DTU2_9ACTN|nr:helix-turn-helix transcriptional regulator [Plantactinospora endophytica]GIG85865.1 transcriptional regulator [Plantactinospora endophytica]
MPPAQPSPILRRRRLGTELRKLRESAKLTGDQVIEAVGWASASKLSRLENGRSRPDLRDVLDLLDLYKVTGPLREELTAITNEAGDMRAWLRSYATMTPRQRVFAELEAGCAEIREYSPVIVPGLLQTRAYVKLRILSSRQLVDDPDQDDTDPENEIAARIARQSLLTREVEPPHYSAVIEEAALGGRAGPREALRAQLVQLRKLAALPNVTIQVLPADQTIADWYLPHTGFSLYRFAEPQDPETLAIEGLATNLMVTDQKEINTYSMVFDWLRDAAYSPEETVVWLTDMAGQRSSGPPRKPASRDPGMPPSQRSRRSGRLTEQ